MAPVPNEVVDEILEHVYHVCHEERRHTGALAAVSPFWQRFFEAKHFSELNLYWQNFPKFDEYVVGRKRKLVKRIRANITIGRSQPGESAPDTFQYAITSLFRTLASWWDIYDGKNPGRVVLEISAGYCKGFSLHWPFIPGELVYTDQLLLSRTHPVYAINELVLSQNAFDIFKLQPRALHYLLRSLPVLQTLHSENRVLPSTTYWEREASHVYHRVFQSLPASVKELRLFEEPFSPFSHNCICSTGWLFNPDGRHLPVDELSSALDLARVSRQLRHLSASFVADAADFFRPLYPPCPCKPRPPNTDEWFWEDLETLALTARLLQKPHRFVREVDELLCAVSRAVRRMPKLRVLEMWGGDDGAGACVFRYRYDPGAGRASLTLIWTRGIVITRDTRRSWAKTVRQKTGLPCEFRSQRLKLKRPFMGEAVSCFLELRDRVATQTALAFARSFDNSITFLPEVREYWDEKGNIKAA